MSALRPIHDLIGDIPRFLLLEGPTPLYECKNLRKTIPGSPHIFVKRDDLSGFLCGGNKLRKLEYIMADAKAQGATVVATTGSIQSNHARVTAMVARSVGLKCVLVLNGEIPSEPFSNFLLSRALSFEVHYVESREERMPRLEEISGDLEKKGEKVYRIPLGSSNEVGALGLLAAYDEMVIQSEERGLDWAGIVLASSSGGTQAGLEAGKRIHKDHKLRIIGISPDDSVDSIRTCILDALHALLGRLSLPSSVNPSEIMVDERFIGPGYGISSAESNRATELFLKMEGIFLDPVYTSKAAAGLLRYCTDGSFRPDDKILFWHTGGLLALFR